MAKFQKGHPRIGGREKGTPNRQTKDLFGKCEELGLDPFAELIKIANLGEDPIMRFQAIKELCQYLYPKRKAIEHSGNISQGILEEAESIMNLPKEELIKVVQEEMKKVKK